jgi:hypothetical protein
MGFRDQARKPPGDAMPAWDFMMKPNPTFAEDFGPFGAWPATGG